jgi:hypothetical protein
MILSFAGAPPLGAKVMTAKYLLHEEQIKKAFVSTILLGQKP